MIECYSLIIDSIQQKAIINFRFESGQSVYSVDEIKLFKKSDGNYKVIYSHHSGYSAALDQDDLIAYDYDVNARTLIVDTETSKFLDFNLYDFINWNKQDSLKIDTLIPPITHVYELYYVDMHNHDIELRLFSFSLSVDLEANENFLGNMMGFRWTGEKFIKLEPCFW